MCYRKWIELQYNSLDQWFSTFFDTFLPFLIILELLIPPYGMFILPLFRFIG